MKRLAFGLLLLGLPALAQVYLLRPDGTTAQDVRGTLSGTARDGYRVSVEFLVEQGANPRQGTMSQPLTWNGRFYTCAPDCTYFSLSGWSPGGTYFGATFDIYDAAGNRRGRARVDTILDDQNRPQYHQVQWAIWPLQGTKVWMASPDSPVPLEAGGWLQATRPGGTRERYRYPGMESYQPPATGSFFAGLSEADRDLARKSLISSLADLRAFYGRQAAGGTIWFFVPEVSPWTLTLAQEWASRRSGQARFVVPENTARDYCSTSYRNDPRFYVLPRKDLPKERSIAVIWPPQGQGLPGAAMAGRYLVDRPDWQETDWVSFTTALIPTAQGLPEAEAQVWGYISQANLKARVRFKEFGLASWPNYSFYDTFQSPWDGRLTKNVGNGQETFTLVGFQEADYYSWTYFPLRDTQGRDRGYAYVYGYGTTTTRTTTLVYEGYYPTLDGVSFTAYGETFTFYNCSSSTCRIRDAQGRDRGYATLWYSYIGGDVQEVFLHATVYITYASLRTYTVYSYIRGWTTTWRWASDNDRPVEAGGYVTAEGKRYRIPGLEGYLMPVGRDIEAVEGDPYVTYITRSLLPDRNPYAGLGAQAQEQGAGTWYKPLRTWCQEVGR